MRLNPDSSSRSSPRSSRPRPRLPSLIVSIVPVVLALLAGALGVARAQAVSVGRAGPPARPAANGEASARQPASAEAPAQDAAVDPRMLSLRPGDMVRIQVWRQPELSGDFFVADNGYIAHPLYRSIYAIGRPVKEVEESLRLFLLEYETEPNFVVEAFFQVAVGGQVRQPNVHALRPGTTVAEAVARAGGVTEQGRLDRVILRRAGQEYSLDLTDAAGPFRTVPINSGDEIVVRERRSRFRDYVLPVIQVMGSVAAILRLVIDVS